ncbi:hypothetical protein AYO50_01780 [Acidobacteria bacterium SCGC AG-212-P17]|nr:hypothetical protein AYO50_01780 [Acidobacteria bacterium SCGC AG-212-P17]
MHRPFVLALAEKSEALWEKITTRRRPLLDDLLYLQTYITYIDKLLANTRIRRYLVKNHNVTLSHIEKLIAGLRLATVDLEEDSMTVWSLARAQKDLAELIKQAQTNGPQHIKKRHEPCVIVISTRRWNAMLRRFPELEEFFFQRQCPWTKKVGRANPQQPDTQARRFD